MIDKFRMVRFFPAVFCGAILTGCDTSILNHNIQSIEFRLGWSLAILIEGFYTPLCESFDVVKTP